MCTVDANGLRAKLQAFKIDSGGRLYFPLIGPASKLPCRKSSYPAAAAAMKHPSPV